MFVTSYKSEKRCGIVNHTKTILDEEGNFVQRDFGGTPFRRRSYVEETDAEMDMWIEIYPTYGNNTKQIKLIVTPFRKTCTRTGQRGYRTCPGSKRCVLSELFCDGVINCPEMPKDEEAEYCEEKLPPLEKYYPLPYKDMKWTLWWSFKP